MHHSRSARARPHTFCCPRGAAGYIPDSVTKMTRLKELVLQNNGLRGFECLQSDGCEFNMPLLQRLDVSGMP